MTPSDALLLVLKITRQEVPGARPTVACALASRAGESHLLAPRRLWRPVPLPMVTGAERQPRPRVLARTPASPTPPATEPRAAGKGWRALHTLGDGKAWTSDSLPQWLQGPGVGAEDCLLFSPGVSAWLG